MTRGGRDVAGLVLAYVPWAVAQPAPAQWSSALAA